MSPKMPGRLSVKGFAGVTLRTARCHHSIGVLPGPPRGGRGYRRYGGKEVIELVHVARLRALGMPLAQIAQRVSVSDSDDVSLTDALGALADKLDVEISRLLATRNRLRGLAGSEIFSQPVKALTQTLHDRGVLGPADHIWTDNDCAAAVLAALYPEGMPGVLAQAGRLLGDSTVMAALGPLRRRLGKLSAGSSDAEIAARATDVAAVLPSGEVEGQVDIGLVDLLLTDRLNPTQQRFMHQLRAHVQGTR